MNITQTLCNEYHVAQWQIDNLIELLNDGNTLPFIARYRKEQHGSLDDQVLRQIADRYQYLCAFEKRKGEIEQAITAQEKMTSEIQQALEEAQTQSQLEDIFRPYKQKRRTRASIAKEKGLEPFAEKILAQDVDFDLTEFAKELIDPEKELDTVELVINGALDILAELVSDDAQIRDRLRRQFWARASLVSKAAKDEDSVYQLYYDFAQPIRSMAGYRVLAINRGEKEGFLKVSISLVESEALAILERAYLKEACPSTPYLLDMLKDSYARLIFPSIERELRQALTDQASEAALQVFSLNLKNLLMQPPLKGQVVLALDPGIRTGCKVAVINAHSEVLDTGVIFPLPSHQRVEQAQKQFLDLLAKHQVAVIAIGNGTASRETEQFVVNSLKHSEMKASYTIVNEAGASVYSASPLAAQEFPDMDVSLRSAVSIARRLQDPLAELVKIDPKSIGVGQYQHDMKPARLDEVLSGVVEDCVNAVGVDVNTASPALLSYIAGIGPALAQNIVAFRQENGAFSDRVQLKKVKKLGSKAFEQCAGFLRVMEGKNPLDKSAVHPESYPAAKKLLSLLQYNLKNLSNISDLQQKTTDYGLQKLCDELEIGMPTLQDIIQELLKPGRDPREGLPPVLLRSDVLEIKDLFQGMELTGTVRNVVDFGAFVDIGVHHDGLVHISKMSKQRINHPSQVLQTGDIVTVYVESVDIAKNRIALSLFPIS